MPREIQVTVDRQGRITVDFIGFLGKECEDEAEMLRRALRSMGLVALPLQVRMKSEEETAAETREPEEEREGARRQVGTR
ncbi:MAG: hypothetical protein AB1446_12595 [Bacillota bacterium]